jgi:hypothetical protein
MGKSIKGALSYNEQKVRQGSAQLIFAAHFSRDVSEMGFSEKLARFEKLTQLNEKSKTNTLHLSLNFSPDDALDAESVQRIAADYMERIGFGNQPYLVYQHNDTAHPHIHIVTTTIRQNGKAVYLHNIAKQKSEPARKAIEQEYGLIKAESRKNTNALPLRPVPLQAAFYGHTETKRVISNIVREVASTYKFSSIEELNTVLRQYNVIADRGNPNSKMFLNRGLVYSLLDRDGYKIGTPIKSSSIFTNPTLSSLEKKFEQNKVRKISSKDFTARTISYVLTKSKTAADFSEMLRQKNITSYVNKKAGGAIVTISFVDNRNKTVFTNDELGLGVDQILKRLSYQKTKQDCGKNLPFHDKEIDRSELFKTAASFELIKDLLTAEKSYDDISPEFLKRKRKKRRH